MFYLSLILFSSLSFADVSAELKDFMKDNKLEELAFEVRNLKHEVCLSVDLKLPREKAIPIASSTKWVTSSILLRLVSQNLLSLETTTGKVLGWKGEKGQITLKQLLNFTSGLPENIRCIRNPFQSLETCVEKIYKDNTPLTKNQFDYGSTHMQVAARMAEVVTSKSWNEIVRQEFVKPLDLKSEIAFYTLPRRFTGRQPLAAGGMAISYDDYLTFLSQMVSGNYLSEDLQKKQRQRVFSDETVIGHSPYKESNYEYGLGVWRECDPKSCASEPMISSAGAFGFYPWIDRGAENYGALGVVGNPGLSRKSFLLLQKLRPEITKITESCGKTISR